MNEFGERRKEPRKKIMAFTPVYDLDKNALLGHIRNLTLHGALVIGEKYIEVDTYATLKWELPGGLPNIAETHLITSARVARCIELDGPENFEIGFEFLDVNSGQTEIIEALLERYHFTHT